MIAGLRVNETLIVSETVGYGWTGLRLHYAIAGLGNAVRESKGCKGHESEADFIGGLRRTGAGAFPGDFWVTWSRRRWTTPATELRE